MFFWDCVVGAVCFCFGLGAFLEFFGERDIVEECPGVVELAVPCSFEVAHSREEFVEFFITDEGEEGGIYARRVRVVSAIEVGTPERFGRLANGCLN